MIRHIVLIRFKQEVSAAQKAEIFEALHALGDHLQGILDFRAGANVSPETHVVHGYHDGFWFDFTDAAARNAYLEAPAHKAVGQRLVAATQGGRDGLIVFDIELST